jgi:hypothetical protein
MTSFLEKYKRQPKLFIDLPTSGKWYPSGALDDDQFVHLPVFGMTAMDEIIIKTPDALFSGEATAQVLQSCIPNIKQPWDIPTFDLDYLLIAIRIATYGESLDVSTTCPHCGESTDSSVQLPNLLESYNNKSTEYKFNVDDLTIVLKPITYRKFTEFNLREYTLQRQIIAIGNSDLDQLDRDKETKRILEELARLNLEIAVSHIESLSAEGELENDPKAIYNFIAQTDAKFFDALKDAVGMLKENWDMPDMEVKCANEECGKVSKTSLDVDYSNFFAQRR